MRKKYIVAFNRDRDFYQVPLALAEVNALDRLITDLYIPDALKNGRLAKILGIAHRRVKGISSTLVHCSLYALYQQIVCLRFAKGGPQRSAIFNSLDKHLSELAGREAMKRKCSLLLYSGYALEAFERVSDETERVLFLYHPLGRLSVDILKDDVVQHPEAVVSHRNHLVEIAESESGRFEKEIVLADRVICASQFTANSVKYAFRPAEFQKPVLVAPYGCFPEAGCSAQSDTGRNLPHFLFVGQGVQRKGLHHLLKVWRRGFDGKAKLTLVVSKLDPGIGRLAEGLKNVAFMEGLSRTELTDLYAAADVFVMPSLVEGFGLVYLEALSAGCHIIGTRNTGLPDLNPPEEAVSLVDAGDLAKLEQTMGSVLQSIHRRDFDRSAIRQFAETCRWEHFRAAIRAALSLPEPLVPKA